MGLFSKQFANVVEWNETDDSILLWKWNNNEIKKDSKLIIRPGQDAIFMYNGRIEGIFEEEGEFDIESDIIPFLTTLKSFKFGFNTPMRAEVLFVNTREALVKWGTKGPISIKAPGLPAGMPIRCFGTFACKVDDITTLLDKISGIKKTFTVEEVKERMLASLDQLLMSWISKEGKDMFNLQADAASIAKGIMTDLDMDLRKIGITVTDFKIENFNYPEQISKMQEKVAAQSVVGDLERYQQMAMLNSVEKGAGSGAGGMASDMVQMQMGMALGQQMVNQMNQTPSHMAQTDTTASGVYPKFCPTCGNATTGSKFCGNCGAKLS